ncbi:helix-turn-helix domain-containing protein [Comamonas flocculans]|uniref:helix-turn-helix domain-containing protein n=1 Tax=Comamonas flocculans TaxID=2597701 RepID=UPI003D78D487
MRLREERERLGMSQEAFGAMAGVRKQAQLLYEKGERSPDARYLSAIAAAGTDVLYILTGQRSQSAPAAAALPPRARALLDNYESTDEEGRRFIERAADLEAKSTATGRKKAARGRE